MRRRGLVGGAGVAAAVALVSACAQIPRSGPVVEVQDRQQALTSQGLYHNPEGPQPGDSPSDIVTGFLLAMTATPLQTNTAAEFLSSDARLQWQPERRVITYEHHSPSRGTTQVTVHLQGADEVGASGQWQGALRGAARRLEFPMVSQGGQWRIDQVPNALIVPRTFYDQEYQEAAVYLFDPSGRILVPEPVHVPQGSQLATALVRDLVRGPAPGLADVARTFIPPGLASPASVPVSAGGVASVTLTGQDPGPLSNRTRQLILTQLAWTLRQDASIHSFRLNIAGHQVADSEGIQVFRTSYAATGPLDPAVGRSSPYYYALRKGRLVSGQISHPSSVDGPFGSADTGIGAFAVSLDGMRAAGVTPTALLVGLVQEAGDARRVLSGTGLLRPAWDFAGRLWDIQDTPSGARVFCLAKGHLQRVTVPGVTGADVRRFLVSRDGSRLVAVLRGATADRIVVSRLRYVGDRPERATRARPIPWVSNGTTRVRDIGWTTPTTIEVLDQPSRSQAEARILNVDGSTPSDEAPTVTIPGHAIGLVTSPNLETPYAVLAGPAAAGSPVTLYSLASVDSAAATVDAPNLSHITYAG